MMVAACGGDSDDTADGTTTSIADDAPAVEPSDTSDADESDADGSDDDDPATGGPADTTADDGEGDHTGDPTVPSVPHDEGIDDHPVAVADLTGEIAGGPADVAGRFEAVIETAGELCVALRTDATELSAVHVHVGAPGETGDVLVTLTDVLAPSAGDDWLAGCTSVADDVESALVNSTDALYVDVHTPEHPDGALRGQLAAATLFDLELR